LAPVADALASHPASSRQKCDPDKYLQNSNKSRLCFFTPRAFSMFTTFGYPLGCHPGSLLQKCAPDKYSQNLNKSRLCFLTHQAFFIVVPLAVPWGPILDPCSKSMTLTSVATIQIRIVSVFLAIKHFPFSLLGLSLGMPSWILAAKV